MGKKLFLKFSDKCKKEAPKRTKRKYRKWRDCFDLKLWTFYDLKLSLDNISEKSTKISPYTFFADAFLKPFLLCKPESWCWISQHYSK